ncbi:MAG: hypothetical protein PHX14_06640 [Syntrophomonadaceae bacterium]|nr:hypothetical protein [Syntrophomonadaceae bacterium]
MSKIAELKETLSKKQRPDDVIMAILAKTKGDSIIKDPSKIHQSIYELSIKNQVWGKYLDAFYFDISGITPFSDLLDQVLSRLETSSLLATPNPRYEEYHLKKEFLSRSIKKFDSSEQQTLQDMADEFNNLLYSH